MSLMPAIFISHGPPTIALVDSPVSRFLRALGGQLPRPKAVICVSAHWEAAWPMVTGSAAPTTIHDFGGPPALFARSYPCPGSCDLAESVVKSISQAGLKATVDRQRGLDHGAWVPLSLIYPEANIPVVELSVQTEMDPRHHLELGRILSPLRRKDVLIMGSGGATHNLDAIGDHAQNADPVGYARQFDSWLRRAIEAGETEEIIDYKTNAPKAERNHPYPAEHFLPLFVPMGSAGRGVAGRLLHEGFMYGVLSMAAYAWE